jgi:hypothetical protein
MARKFNWKSIRCVFVGVILALLQLLLLGGCFWQGSQIAGPEVVPAADAEVLTTQGTSVAPLAAQITSTQKSIPIKFTAETSLKGFNFDTGWWPSRSPVQLRLLLRANPPRAKIELPGELKLSYPSWVKPGQNVVIEASFKGTSNAGYLLDAFGFLFETKAKINATVAGKGISWEGNIPLVPSVDLDVTVDTKTDNTPFTPFLLDRTFTASDEGSWTFGLKDFNVKDIATLEIGLNVGATVESSLRGKRISVTASGKTTTWYSENVVKTFQMTIPKTSSGTIEIPITCEFEEDFRHTYTLWAEFVATLQVLEVGLDYHSPRLSRKLPIDFFVDLKNPTLQTVLVFNVDGTPPSLLNPLVQPSNLPATGGTVNLSVTATDAHSGVRAVVAKVTAPDGKITTINLSCVSGDAASGTWRGSFTVAANSTSKERQYLINFVAQDLVGNEVVFPSPLVVVVAPQEAAGGPVVVPPNVETRPATDITSTAATIQGAILNNGGAPIVERRLDWGTTPACSDGWTNQVTVSGNTFSFRLTGLKPNTTYYFRASAKNTAGWGQGAVLSFRTSSTTSSLTFTDLKPTEIVTSKSTDDAELTATGTNFFNVVEITFRWSGPDNGVTTWKRGSADWSEKVRVLSDTQMILKPRVLANVTGTTTKTWTWTVTLKDNTGASASRQFTVTYQPPAASFDFAVSASPSSGTVTRPTSGTATVSTTVRAWKIQGLDTAVNFTITGLPSDVSASPSTWSWTLGDRSQSVTFSVGPNAPTGTYTIRIRGTARNITREGTFTLTINAPSGPRLTFTDLKPTEIVTSKSTDDAELTATGTNFFNVVEITFRWSGPDNGVTTWKRGSADWSEKVRVLSDTQMILKPRVLANVTGTTTKTWTWTVTLKDNTGASASRQFTVTYQPPAAPTPYITGINPPQPKAQPTRQWIAILGSGFVAQSQVILRYGNSTYIIPPERTQFVSSNQINVYVGLTDPGTWTAQVVNPGNKYSNIYTFQVKP